MSSIDYLTEALTRARKVLSPEDFTTIHMAARGHAGGKARWRIAVTAEPEEGPEIEPEDGPTDVLFVAGQASPIEIARGIPFAGEQAKVFAKYYASAPHKTVHAVPSSNGDVDTWSGWLARKIERLEPKMIVALGQLAETAVEKAIGVPPDETLPHPGALVTKPVREAQVIRKVNRIARALDVIKAVTVSSAQPTISRSVKVAKADKPRQILYAAVLDPYQVDAHNDWVPPIHVEETAHNWLAKSRVIGFEHERQASAYPVESWIVQYPSEDDYVKATKGEPHRIFEMPFGSDVVHSGTWVLGTKLSNEEWAEYEAGNIGAYSVAGFGFRTDTTTAAMPEVEIIKLAEVR